MYRCPFDANLALQPGVVIDQGFEQLQQTQADLAQDLPDPAMLRSDHISLTEADMSLKKFFQGGKFVVKSIFWG